jgi:hypothetical protein
VVGVRLGGVQDWLTIAEDPVLEWIAASVGSVGEAYANAFVETTIALFKTEVVGRGNGSIGLDNRRLHT